MKAPADEVTGAPEQLQREARAWVRRLTAGHATQMDAQAFRRWRMESALHRNAFIEAQRWWKALDPVMARLASENEAVSASSPMPRRQTRGRRAFLGGAVSAAAVAGVAMAHPPFGLWTPADEWGADYRTGTGEQRQIALTDHVNVEINTVTSIMRQQVNGQTVGIELISGEAAIDLLAPGRRFSVKAGVGRSVAEGGHFEVRHTDGTTCVTCVDGTLRIEHPRGTRTLTGRQQIIYDRQSLRAVSVVEPAVLSAWRDGVLVFRQTPLTQVIDEINRYRPGRVVLLDRDVGNREVNGRFAIHTLDTVLLQIQHTYELNARKLPGGLLVLS